MKEKTLSITNNLTFRKSNQKLKEWRSLNEEKYKEDKNKVKNLFLNHTPHILYFPDFIFTFPEKIFLNKEKETHNNSQVQNILENEFHKNEFYKTVFQDILKYDNMSYNIEKHILERLKHKDNKYEKVKSRDDINGEDKSKIEHILDKASSVVTDIVFEKWNKILKEKVQNKKVQISFDIDTNDGIYIKLQIKEGAKTFDINNRSIGFRWFFSFILFTQFRAAREKNKQILFLLDEPASNLHAAAQQKLIESFSKITEEKNTLAYTTHSHHMIDPKWLEQIFVITNSNDLSKISTIETKPADNDLLDIKATKYREFFNKYPDETTYFQPILDKLQVIPSKFDIQKGAVVLEGKSDYYILRYAKEYLEFKKINFIPGVGAGSFDSLVSIQLGWNLNMLFLLDGDKQGKKGKERYIKKFILKSDRVLTLDELNTDINEIENLLNISDKKLIAEKMDISLDKVSKKNISQFFQENLASNNFTLKLSSHFNEKTKDILKKLEERLQKNTNTITM